MRLYFSSELGAVIRSDSGGVIRIYCRDFLWQSNGKAKKFLCSFSRLQALRESTILVSGRFDSMVAEEAGVGTVSFVRPMQ